MEIKDLIIALMAFAAIGVITFSFVSDLYSADNLDVELDSELDDKFDTMYDKIKTTQNSTDQWTSEFQTYVPGGANASIDNPDITTSDLLKASLKALTNIPEALGIFVSMVGTVAATVGINSAIVGFLIGSLVITIIIILVTAVLKWNSS